MIAERPETQPLPRPSFDEVRERARVVSIPTRTRFRGVTEREALIIEGPKRFSEFSPFPEYADAEAATWLGAALEYGWSAGLPVSLRERVEVNATIPAIDPDAVAPLLASFDGCTTVKVKVAERGQNLDDDLTRVRRVRELMGPEARVRIDANAGWSYDEAITALRALAPFDLDYAEQPCAQVSDLARLREALSAGPTPHVRIAADESVRKADDPLAVARAGAADLLVVKAQPLGGITRAREIILEAGLPVVVSSALDTSVGISMGARLAASLPDGVLDGPCGLATVSLLAGDVVRDSLVPSGGSIAVHTPVVEAELVDRFAASPEREAWWIARLERCHALLG